MEVTFEKRFEGGCFRRRDGVQDEFGEGFLGEFGLLSFKVIAGGVGGVLGAWSSCVGEFGCCKDCVVPFPLMC